MALNVLVTGGAGFIGSHLCKRLAVDGCHVTVLDCFSPQIHGSEPPPIRLQFVDKLVVGDVCDASAVDIALSGQDVVVHLAAETGTGQSMYETVRYETVNIHGTAVLLDGIIRQSGSTVNKVVVAASRAIYGEGAYLCRDHGQVYPVSRKSQDMEMGDFDPRCPICGEFCTSVPTPESAPYMPSSFYGLTKQVQEQMVLMFAQTHGKSGASLRYQNVYGPGQSLKNPYTGILAIFSNLARENKDINIFEDGLESRDFVYIDDVVEATCACIYSGFEGVDKFNVGSGVRTTVTEVADQVISHFGSRSTVRISGAFRVGDIRHNTADLAHAQTKLGFQPLTDFRSGLREFLTWAESQEANSEGFEQSLTEMRSRGLLLGEGRG